VDWRVDIKLNRAIEKIMLCLEGRDTIFDIVDQLDLDYWSTRDFIEKLRLHGLIKALPIFEHSRDS
jgi:hypothetical protein